MKNKKILIPLIILAVILLVGIIYLFTMKNTNFVKLNYNEILNKVENKDDFVLCVSAKDCIHCQEYKPKLEKISNKYDIMIYYVDIDEFTEEEYQTFKTKFSFDGGTPTTIFFKNGEEKTTANRIEGNTKTEKIINKLKSNGFITK